MTEQDQARKALELIRSTREGALGTMGKLPWWYDAGYALACGILVAGQGYGTATGLICTGIGLGLLAFIIRKYQTQTGFWVNGYTPKKARWVAFALGGFTLALMIANVQFGRLQGIAWVPVVTGLVAAVVAVAASRLWMRVYRKEVRDLA